MIIKKSKINYKELYDELIIVAKRIHYYTISKKNKLQKTIFGLTQDIEDALSNNQVEKAKELLKQKKLYESALDVYTQVFESLKSNDNFAKFFDSHKENENEW